MLVVHVPAEEPEPRHRPEQPAQHRDRRRAGGGGLVGPDPCGDQLEPPAQVTGVGTSTSSGLTMLPRPAPSSGRRPETGTVTRRLSTVSPRARSTGAAPRRARPGPRRSWWRRAGARPPQRRSRRGPPTARRRARPPVQRGGVGPRRVDASAGGHRRAEQVATSGVRRAAPPAGCQRVPRELPRVGRGPRKRYVGGATARVSQVRQHLEPADPVGQDVVQHQDQGAPPAGQPGHEHGRPQRAATGERFLDDGEGRSISSGSPPGPGTAPRGRGAR